VKNCQNIHLTAESEPEDAEYNFNFFEVPSYDNFEESFVDLCKLLDLQYRMLSITNSLLNRMRLIISLFIIRIWVATYLNGVVTFHDLELYTFNKLL